jgi:hypothetical protein
MNPTKQAAVVMKKSVMVTKCIMVVESRVVTRIFYQWGKKRQPHHFYQQF